ncbi:Acetyl xylan esterase [Thermoanaerobacter italicus Ab9]|uniref:Acetyl xylan esterase n=1 Tax=Thermoanaerobacter italicus (strain DSM 9252 / Ab9) TaxID=580331 RepID=D3T419_THEIA|nr:alpha/beta hydrolase family protein [Thermoanaerobacter italicus]ADD02971.1 Acetyl xylan esterase [Thermoanaerobacter italicus Ab9]
MSQKWTVKDELRPLYSLKKLYDTSIRSMGFELDDPSGFEQWRVQLKGKVIKLLGDFPERVPLEPQVLECKEFDNYIREKVVFHSAPYIDVPAYILLPKGIQGKVPGVVALHGHGYGKNDLVGLWEDGTERSIPDGYQGDFALEIVRRGMAVIVPDQIGFGERREMEDIERGYDANSCRKLAFWAHMLGKTAVGMRVWDVMRSIDYLATLPQVDQDRIGCMGISGGGTTTLFAAALDERIKAAVISGYLNTFKDSIMSIYHCECNYIPGILKYAEMYDIASMIAPRPLLIENGTKDMLFPIEAANAAYEHVKRAYKLLKAEDKLDRDVFEGRHRISGRKAYDWLERWL